MQAKPLAHQERLDWDRFAAASPNAWFWHIRTWADYIKAYAGAPFQQDLLARFRNGRR